MTENQNRDLALVLMLKSVLLLLSVVLQANFVLMIQVFTQYQALQREICQAIEDDNRAARRYRQLRRRFVARKQRRRWKNPGRTEMWWSNAWNGLLLEEEWISNFRMSRNDFMALEEKLRPYIKPKQNSFRGDTIPSIKKLGMTLYFLKDQGFLKITSNTFGVAPCPLSIIVRKVCQATDMFWGQN